MPHRAPAILVTCSLLVAACQTEPSHPRSAEPTRVTASPSPEPGVGTVHVRLVQVASVDQPLALALRPHDPALYVAEKTGRIVAIRDGRVDPEPVLDIAGDVSLGSEQGLLGLAFSLDGRFLYIDYTDTAGDTHVDEYALTDGAADPASRRTILTVAQPFSNHNGGNLVFGPDGDLYIGLGDGGSGGDPYGNGQSLSTLLGKILRITPRPAAGHHYGIPPDNPFVGRSGARPEIWAYGLRNPWRFTFDRDTGDLWIGDVGQSAWEEIDRQPADSVGGENYGWNAREGDHPYDTQTSAPGAVDPVFEYPHDGGVCAVTGGYVYRGSAIEDLFGSYVFADFCAGDIEALRIRNGRVAGHRSLGVTVPNLSSFGEDAAGELYALSLSGGIYRLAPG